MNIWDQPRPSVDDVNRMWLQVAFRSVPTLPASVEKYVQELRLLLANGGVKAKCFEMPENPVFLWFAAKGMFGEIDFFDRFLASREFTSAMQDAAGRRWDGVDLVDTQGVRAVFTQIPVLHLACELTEQLVWGGVYRKFEQPIGDARQLASDASDALVSSWHGWNYVYVCHTPWSRWFFGDEAFGRDETVIISDYDRGLIWVLCWTDTE